MQLPETSLSIHVIEILEDHGIDTVDKLLRFWSHPEGPEKILMMPRIGMKRFHEIKKFIKKSTGSIFDTRKKK